MHNKILIIDFGSQTTQLIARRLREFDVYCEVVPYDCEQSVFDDVTIKGLILSGGPESVTQQHSPAIPTDVFTLEVPILAICYGMQAMAKHFGGQVKSASKSEFGHAQVTVCARNELLNGIEDDLTEAGESVLKVWMSHGDQVIALPDNFNTIASTDNAPIAAMANIEKHYYALQFHPEVTHSLQGARILERFAKNICQLNANWTVSNIIEESILRIKQQVGSDNVLLGLSGGVDSAVTAALLHKAIGEQLTCVFVDTGLLRLNEAQEVRTTFAEHFGIKLICVEAEQAFFQALQGVTDPEAKRKVIGKLFIDVFAREANMIDNMQWLAQGTIYPDVIESAGNQSAKGKVIKSHHNVGGLPDDLPLQLIEPLRDCFKDEVRKIGLALGLPYEMVYRHPFPGPGLAVRLLGEVQQSHADILRKADHIFIQALRKHEWYDKVSQAFAVFLPVNSVGVTGDNRRYAPVIGLRAVTTTDFMTAQWARLPYDLLDEVAHQICNEIPDISRVVYDVSGKPPATIEWE